MKKTFRFVLMAVAVIASASCAKEFVESAPVPEGAKVSFTLSFSDDATKTTLAAGKTVWAKGDSILFSDGSKTEKIGIPDEFVGKAYAEVDVDITKIDASDTIYAVYPPEAYKSAKAGVVSVAVNNNQSGNFEQANICVGMAKDYHFTMSNATSVLKFSVPEGIETVVLTAAAKDTLAGQIAVTCSTENPISIKASSPLKSIKVVTGGVDGDYYVSVVPGTYSEFTLMALSLDGKSQKKVATDKTLAVNDLADLGIIGNELAGATLEGSGSETDPFVLKDLADMTTLATSVSNGLSYAGQYFKLNNDVEDVATPIGTYDQVPVPFEGIFDGANHTVTLAMGSDESEEGYLALFGSLGEGAVVKDLTIAGTVSSKGSYIAGLAAYSNVKDAGVTITNVTNNAAVKGNNYVGGLLAYFNCNNNTAASIENCHNTGAVTSAGYTAGGVAAYAIYGNFKNCDNTGAVESKTANGPIYSLPATAYVYADFDGKTNVSSSGAVTRGTAGVVGVAYNTTVVNCVNNGAVKGVSKVGGVVGTTYWGSITECQNNAAVTASADFAGGIVGMQWVSGTVSKCTNAADVTANAVVGGIVGISNAQERSSNAYLDITNCINNGKVVSVGKSTSNEYNYGFANTSAAGGIVGAHKAFNKDFLRITGCTNNAAVSGVGQAVGGVLGYFGCPRNGADQGAIDGCVNNGEVSSDLYRAGGIVGVLFDRFTTCRMVVRNCVNTGKVTAPIVVAGIVGWGGPAYPAKDTDSKLKIYNCINLGEIAFTDAETEKAYPGTICGYFQQIDIQNCYNAGTVTAPEGAKATTGYAGLLFGQPNAYNAIKYIYTAYDETIYNALKAVDGNGSGILYGSAKPTTSTVANTLMVNLEGMFDTDVTVNSTVCSDPVAALNAWIGTSTTYMKWAEGENGPEFAK